MMDGECFDACAALNAQAQEENWPQFHSAIAKDFEQPELQELLALWRMMAEKRQAIPARSDFDARALKPYLRNLLLQERIGADRWRVRLMGSALAARVGEWTGRTLEEVLPPKSARRWSSVAGAVFAARQAVRISARFELPAINYLKGEALGAPLCDDDGKLAMVLFALYFAPV